MEMKDIKGFEGRYAITTTGKVYSYYLKDFLSPQYDETSYGRVHLSKDGTRYPKFLHRLVAEAFLPNPENKPTVDHIDRNPRNNNVENLRWATHKEQEKNKCQESRHQHTLDMVEKRKKKVAMIDVISRKTLHIFSSTREAARFLEDENKASSIAKAANGKLNLAYGYIWRYL